MGGGMGHALSLVTGHGGWDVAYGCGMWHALSLVTGLWGLGMWHALSLVTGLAAFAHLPVPHTPLEEFPDLQINNPFKTR